MSISTSDLLKTKSWEVEESPVDLGYRPVPDWGRIPAEWTLGPVAGVGADSQDRVYLFHRGHDAPPLLCFNADGDLLFSREHIAFGRPHMVTIDVDDNVWLTDDGAHIIYKLSPNGEILFALGVKDVPGEDGIHFNQPTDIGFNAQREIYVSDGYGNKRVAKFDAEGNFQLQWGEAGEGPGQFALPHALHLDDQGLVYVADRENWRIQVFLPDGRFKTQWQHLGRPMDLVFSPDGYFYMCDHPNGRVTKFDKSGQVIGFFGESGRGLGQLTSAHDITYSPNGDIIVGMLDGRVQKFTQNS